LGEACDVVLQLREVEAKGIPDVVLAQLRADFLVEQVHADAGNPRAAGSACEDRVPVEAIARLMPRRHLRSSSIVITPSSARQAARV
jgi:hypothetical protein